jgi:hypothetical protein
MTLLQRWPVLLSGLATLAIASKPAYAQQSAAFEPPPPPPDEEVEPPPPEAEPPSSPPERGSFERQLSPYGRWVDTSEYGRVWMPNVDPDWQPYADGRWVSTTWGWSFASPVPWGWAVYHYGRWGWRAGFGWFWVPGYVWGPAWVSWRWMNGYACWSPLGPRGFAYGRYWPGWVVVPHSHFAHPIRRFMVPRARVGVIVGSARPVRAFPTWQARGFEHHGGEHHGGEHHSGHGRRR